MKKAMEKRNEQFGQDGREHGWCSSKYPQGVAKAYLQCLFFFCICVPKYYPFQGSEEMLTTCRAAESSWVKKESDANTNTKQVDEKTTHSKLQLTFLKNVFIQFRISQKLEPPCGCHYSNCTNTFLHIHMALSTKTKLQN